MNWQIDTIRTLLLVTIALVIMLAFSVTRRHEQTLKQGQIVVLALTPVDPRSIMQGDYMALRFDLDTALERSTSQSSRPRYAFLRLDDKQLASAIEASGDKLPAPQGTIVMKIRYDHGTPSLGPNAFFFQEGHAQAYQQARFAQFRVTQDGTSLLVTLLDKDLQPIDVTPPPVS